CTVPGGTVGLGAQVGGQWWLRLDDGRKHGYDMVKLLASFTAFHLRNRGEVLRGQSAERHGSLQ
ncbi:hypothetical protein FRC15_006769, partial [Serendipita sp. 397]